MCARFGCAHAQAVSCFPSPSGNSVAAVRAPVAACNPRKRARRLSYLILSKLRMLEDLQFSPAWMENILSSAIYSYIVLFLLSGLFFIAKVLLSPTYPINPRVRPPD